MHALGNTSHKRIVILFSIAVLCFSVGCFSIDQATSTPTAEPTKTSVPAITVQDYATTAASQMEQLLNANDDLDALIVMANTDTSLLYTNKWSTDVCDAVDAKTECWKIIIAEPYPAELEHIHTAMEKAAGKWYEAAPIFKFAVEHLNADAMDNASRLIGEEAAYLETVTVLIGQLVK